MVVMLDGTGTVLGSQIPAAVFGYIIGVVCCMTSFFVGQKLAGWIRVTSADDVQDEEQGNVTTKRDEPVPCPRLALMTVFLCALLCCLFIYADGVAGIEWYRHLWMCIIFAPLGSLTRWKLASWNDGHEQFPLGTFSANVGASVVLSIMTAIYFRFMVDNPEVGAWTRQFWAAIGVGFLGSLSTASTLVKEMMIGRSSSRGHIYCWTTILASALLGLAVYSPIVRS